MYTRMYLERWDMSTTEEIPYTDREVNVGMATDASDPVNWTFRTFKDTKFLKLSERPVGVGHYYDDVTNSIF
jgi:hypothetical protein